jgi:hypothetical protein
MKEDLLTPSDLKLIYLNRWLELKAKAFERQRRFREATRFWENLLRRLTHQSASEEVDVARLAAIHYRLGLAHRALNDDRKSLYHLKYSVRLNSSEPRYYEAFGRAFLSGGHWRVARAQFEKAIRLDPKNVTYIRQAAWVLLMMGRKNEALQYARRAFGLQKTRESALSLARVYMEMNMFFHALQLLKAQRKTKRVSAILSECLEKLELTSEGAVLKCLRKGIVCDGNPFSLWDLRRAEDLWTDFCISKSERPAEQTLPNVWAAALSALVLFQRAPSGSWNMDDLAVRFGATTIEIWPRLKDLQESLCLASGAPQAA